MRHLDPEEGLHPSDVRSLAQDSTGFLWIGTVEGLFRYDGREVRSWTSDRIGSWIAALCVGPDGVVYALEENGALLRVTHVGTRPVTDGSGRPILDARSADVDREGRLWVLRSDALAVRDGSGRWSRIAAEAFEGERLRLVFGGPRGADVATATGLWSVRPRGSVRRLADAREVDDVVWPAGPGRRFAITRLGRVLEIRPGSPPGQILAMDEARGIRLAFRRGTLWASFDRFLVGLRPDHEPEILGPEEGIDGGGPLMVDREGSLWLGTFTGLYQFPEIETRIWREAQGLVSSHTRFLEREGDRIWVSTWQGLGYLERRGGRWSAGSLSRWPVRHDLFRSSDGVLWLGADSAALEIRGGSIQERHPFPGPVLAFEEADGGSLLVTTLEGFFRLDARSGETRQVRVPPLGKDASFRRVLLDRTGRLWVSSGETLCRAPARPVLSGVKAEWSCQSIPGAVDVTSLVELPDGRIWASSERLGVLRYREGAWERHPGNELLPSDAVLNLVPSRDSGVWVLGTGVLQRVEDRDGDGWKRLERLSAWHGLPGFRVGDLLEEPSGALWLATAQGVVRIPAGARETDLGPPPVALAEARVDNLRVPVHGPAQVPHHRNRLELRFAALSYRDPGRIRYHVRLSPEEGWQDTGRPVFLWVELPPGRYRAQVRASLDGSRWSDEPAGLAFEVRSPWYLRPWALALGSLLVAALLFVVYRARVAFLVGLERHRTRVAMDLHDKMGSGLGSIGILSGVLEDVGLGDEERREVAGKISDAAEELGTGLSDIVWSLDPRAGTLEELSGRLAEHAERLLSRDGVSVELDFPESWPGDPLDFQVRRNVLLIGMEALHNVARHADPRRVRLSLEPSGRYRWELRVEDDGCGLRKGAPHPGRGRGLESMGQRAREVDAEIEWSEPVEGGTRVVLRFDPSGGGPPLRRLWQRLRRWLGPDLT